MALFTSGVGTLAGSTMSSHVEMLFDRHLREFNLGGSIQVKRTLLSSQYENYDFEFRCHCHGSSFRSIVHQAAHTIDTERIRQIASQIAFNHNAQTAMTPLGQASQNMQVLKQQINQLNYPKEDTMSLATKLRNTFLSKNQRVLREAGVLDTEGRPTQEGRDLLWVVLFEEYEDKLVAAVEKLTAADKADKKKA